MKLLPIHVLLPLTLLGALLGATGCSNQTDPGTIVPPVIVRSVFPADEAQVGSRTSDSFRARFNRAVTPGEVFMDVYPAPDSNRAQFDDLRRNLVWEDVQFAPDEFVYRFLIRGPNLLRPVVSRVIRDGAPRAGISGVVVSADSSLVTPRHCLVWAINSNEPFNVLDPTSFDSVEQKNLVAATISFENGSAAYVFAWLPADQTFLLIAVQDSNGDGLYQPGTDWWGYHHLPGDPAPLPVLPEGGIKPPNADLRLAAPD